MFTDEPEIIAEGAEHLKNHSLYLSDGGAERDIPESDPEH